MWFALTFVVLGLSYYFLKKLYSYWKDRGVPGPEPVFIFGNTWASMIGKKSNTEVRNEIYRDYDRYPFVGIYRMFTPCLMIRDPQLIKNVLIKDFKYFQNNDFHVDQEVDKIFGRNPFALAGAEWKAKRAQLTVCFTSGKIKAMFSMLEQVSQRLVKYVNEKSVGGNAVLESREVCVRYTLDNVAACVFGLEGQCFEQDNSVFRKLADDIISPGSWQTIKLSLNFIWPDLGKLLKLKMFTQEAEDQLTDMVRETMKQRRLNNVVRNDFLESVTQIFNGGNTEEDELNLVAHAASFFVDGYETTSRVMSFVIYELAANPECQRKLREEITNQCKKTDGKLTYEVVHEIPYLDACIKESQRKNPLFTELLKTCTENYTYTCTDPDLKNLTVNIDKGTSILIPFSGLHLDEKHFKSPEKYMPERFLGEVEYNKQCFIPFGDGPRSCLGMRFALAQLKLGISQLVKNFELSVNSKTQLPLKYDKWCFMLSPAGGLWLNFKKIEQ